MKIAHLYYDIMNLYGDSGNVKLLCKMLEDQGIEITLIKLSINDKLNFDDYDFVYIGSGTYTHQKLALNHLFSYQKDIKNYIEQNKFFLCTGNAMDLFGQKIIDQQKNIECLNIFPYISKKVPRFVKEVNYTFNDLNIIGFLNQDVIIENNKQFWFDQEGVRENNFFATYVTGPLLVRNIFLAKWLIKQLVPNYQDIEYEILEKAYQQKNRVN